ncbi:MAG: ABC transporter ATP-binding protein/permease [Pseudomonadota bacterium]
MRYSRGEHLPHQDRPDFANLTKLSPYVWRYGKRVSVALFCLLLGKFATVCTPLILKEIIDALDRQSGEQLAANIALSVPLALLIAYGALRLASGLFNELRDILFSRVRYSAMHQMAVDVLTHLHKLSLRFHLERNTGGISRDLERGTRSLASVLNLLVFSILPTIAEFVLVGGILLYRYDSILMVVIIGTVLCYIGFTLSMSKWRMGFRHEMNKYDSAANGRAVDSLLNYETVKYFNNESLEVQNYNEQLTMWGAAGQKTQVSLSALNFGQGAIVTVGVTIIMIIAAGDVASGDITIGDLVLINAMMLQLFIPLSILGSVYRSLQYSLADMDLVIKLLEREPEIKDAADAKALNVVSGAVAFDAVSFHYQPDRPILRSISFTVAPGKKVAVVGLSGSGKSTLVRLLFRFYEVTDGVISIDGQSLAQCTQESVRQIIGIVPQDTVLFNNTIRYNIGYANPQATDEAIMAAAGSADLTHLLSRLPEGLDTIVGERGLKLSGGEKQRLAIARVILKAPKIIVFDEATSSLDSRSEQAILQALNTVSENATTLVIAHRLSTVVDADQIVVLDDGVVTETGTHNELLQRDGLYRKLWDMQQSDK